MDDAKFQRKMSELGEVFERVINSRGGHLERHEKYGEHRWFTIILKREKLNLYMSRTKPEFPYGAPETGYFGWGALRKLDSSLLFLMALFDKGWKFHKPQEVPQYGQLLSDASLSDALDFVLGLGPDSTRE